MLPKNERIPVTENREHWRIWLYGQSCSGKTYLADKFPNVLMLNTDGNTTEVTAPRIRIADEVRMDGHIERRKLAWDVFKDTIKELETERNSYETIVLDLIEDFYEFCRLYMYKKMGISHESDSNFKAWDMVRTEFYSTIRRLLALPYNFILLSQEDTSRDITAKNGDKVTAIKPNINDKVAIKLMGMMTVCGRVVKDGSIRTIEFKNNDTVFGGSRIEIKVPVIMCSYKDLMGVLGEAPKPQPELPVQPEPQVQAEAQADPQPEARPEVKPEPQEDIPATPLEHQVEAEALQPRRRRMRRAEAEAEVQPEPQPEATLQPETAPQPDKVVEYGINSDEEEKPAEAPKTEDGPRPRPRRIR